jgi:hypothetical protein
MDRKNVQYIIPQDNSCWSLQKINKDAGNQAKDWGAPNGDLGLLAVSWLQDFYGDAHIPPQE